LAILAKAGHAPWQHVLNVLNPPRGSKFLTC